LKSETVFQDSLYKTFNWSTFSKWEPVLKTVNINNPDYHLLNAALFYHVNYYRQKMKKPMLAFSENLRNAAFYHSNIMSEKGFYNHLNPYERKMREPIQRIRIYGTEADFYGENINKEFMLQYEEGRFFDKDSTGWYYTLPRSEYLQPYTYFELARLIVQGWIDSKHHREILLDINYTHVGFGVVIDKKTINNKQIPKIISTQNLAGGIITDFYNLR
jgi:uncharacterized protein YkwD